MHATQASSGWSVSGAGLRGESGEAGPQAKQDAKRRGRGSRRAAPEQNCGRMAHFATVNRVTLTRSSRRPVS